MPNLSDGGAVAWRQFFDWWRDAYEDLPYRAHQSFYNMVYKTFPDQDKANRAAVTDAITYALALQGRPIRVWELGGWDGALARDMIEACGEGILGWCNTEICSNAVKEGWHGDVYFPHSPPCWPWERPSPYGFDIAVLSHVIEHLSWRHLKCLFALLLDVPLLYFQVPPRMGQAPHPDLWYGTMSTHKLEVGWGDVDRVLRNMGHTLVWNKGNARLYGKIQGV